METRKNPFDDIALEYDQWYDEYRTTFLSDLVALKQFLPDVGKGIEIGTGTGRFAHELGIKEAIEPSENMAEIARSRGIRVTIGEAENLPYDDDSYDYALMVSVDPFVRDIYKVYGEIFRILKPGGKLIVGTLHRDGAVAQKYMAMTDSEVYKNAQFHTIPETLHQLETSGFKGLDTCQTLFEIHPSQVDTPIPGYHKGSFVVVEAIKPLPSTL